MQQSQLIPRDPSLPPVPPPETWLGLSQNCDCPRPVPEERAERRGAAQTYCARCGRPIPIRWSGR